ncbi:MAG: hypothetical protein QOJ55_644 [Solirubrobacteraceae bacterium]|jgi:hypothetical protein|nr:hypothetical protein [Solirubrobacteraceae bacterium]MDX6674557.1 hypothetical protein [Solirubrobacteraceae bacterium]
MDLSSTTGVVALAAAGVAIAALIVVVVLAVQLRRVRAAQSALLGEAGTQDLVAHALELEREFRLFQDATQDTVDAVNERVGRAERRLDGTIAYRGLVRYDAYNEMSGHQSTSIALLDATRSGVVLSSIHHREQARMYAKQVREGEAELELSPEEAEAVRLAMAGDEPPG